MKSKQNNRNGPKVPDVKKQSKMAKHGHKHPVVMGGINPSYSWLCAAGETLRIESKHDHSAPWLGGPLFRPYL